MRMLSVIDVEMPDPDAWQKVISVLLTSMAPDGGPAKEKL